MKKGITPEERLLRLIRAPKKPAPAAPEQAGRIKKPDLRPLTAGLLNFQNIRKGILIAFIISCVYLGAAVIYPLFIPENPPFPKSAGSKTAAEKAILSQEAVPFSSYPETIQNRRLFAGSVLRNEEGGVPVVLGNELIKDINLVGILSGESPQAVIEDKKTQKTYYVARNQLIGKFKVEDIQEGKIILGLNGQKYELYL